MHQAIAPIAVRPWTLNGLSERLLVSHYEHHYGSAVRTLNAVRSEIAKLDARAPDYQFGALKREELAAMGSVVLHELYFGNLGGKGNKIPDPVATALETDFGSAWAWRREFVRAGQSLAHVRLGRADVLPLGEAVLEPGHHGSLPGDDRRGPGPRARHV
jgi:Fe-Mn family superoxide dismutase